MNKGTSSLDEVAMRSLAEDMTPLALAEWPERLESERAARDTFNDYRPADYLPRDPIKSFLRVCRVFAGINEPDECQDTSEADPDGNQQSAVYNSPQ